MACSEQNSSQTQVIEDMWSALDNQNIPISTSTPSSIRRKSRKSWFETNPKGKKFEIAVEKNPTKKPGRKSNVEDEVLLLTHFTNPPKVGFNKMKPNSGKTRTLIIKNPHEYDQQVKIEKFPHKKNFSTDLYEFVVEGESSYRMVITWSPVEEGNFREMILFLVDGVYRVQAFVFGTVEAPPQKKKIRKGLLGTKVKKPFSVLHTPSLANIAKSYSPKKGQKKSLESIGKGSDLENEAPEPSRSWKSSDRTESSTTCSKKVRRKSHRRSQTYRKSLVVSPENGNKENGGGETLCRTPQTENRIMNLESNKVESAEIEHKLLTEHVESKGIRTPKKENKDCGMVDRKERRKSHRRSVTYNKTLDISPIKSSPEDTEKVSDDGKKEKQDRIQNETRITNSDSDKVPLSKVELKLPEVCAEIKSQEIGVLTATEMHQKSEETTQKANFIPKTPEEKLMFETKTNYVSPNSFLHDSICSQMDGKDMSFTDIHSVTRPPFHSTVLPTPERLVLQKGEKDFLSPDSFLKELNNTKENLDKSQKKNYEKINKDEVPSPNSVLNDSIPHEIMIKQLETVKTSLFETKVFRASSTPKQNSTTTTRFGRHKHQVHNQMTTTTSSSSMTTEVNIRRETFVRKDSVKDFCITPISASPRRETFVKSSTIATHFDVPPIVPSPRRETFIVPKMQKRSGTPVSDKRQPLLRSPSSAFRVVAKENSDEKTVHKSRKLNFDNTENQPIKTPDTTVSQVSTECMDTPVTMTTVNQVSTEGIETPTNVTTIHQKSTVESSLTRVDTVTVTKSQSDATKSFEKEKSQVGKCLFSPFEKKNEEEKEKNLTHSFGSSHEIPDSPNKCEFTKRATMTVTKERPSDALLHATQKRISTCLFDGSVLQETIAEGGLKNSSQLNHRCSVISEECETNYEVKKEVNLTVSTSEVNSSKSRNMDGSVSKLSSFPTTPVELPNSPDPDMSRRSTHTVQNPKVLNLTTGQRKCLFPPLNDNDDCETTEVDIKEREDKMNSDDKGEDSMKNDTTNINTENNGDDSSKISDGHERVQSENKDENNVGNEKMMTPSLSKSHCEQKNDRDSKEIQEVKVQNSDRSKSQDLTDGAKIKPVIGFVVFNDGKEAPSSGQKTLPLHSTKKRPPTENKARENKRLKPNGNVSEVKTTVKQVTGPSTTRPKQATVAVTKPVTRKDSNSTIIPKPSVKGLAQSKLILMKKSKTVLPKHPMPFASKNMYYDERWMEKQERGFVHWLNFVLTPAEDYLNSSTKVKVDASKLSLDNMTANVKLAPTKEVLSFREYAAVRRLNQLRRSACKLFQSEAVVRVIQKLEAEIESRRLVIRKDKMIHADLGLKQNILDMLLSYNPLWLRIGLEVVYGELIPIQKNNDVIGLSRFIVTRLLSNPDVAKQYAHPTVPHLYRDGYSDAIARHTLKKFLMLVYFLDYAKSQRLIHHDPCLFCKDSDFKTTKAMLIEFSRDYLSGEGDITRHLAYLGYIVSHSQTAMDEFDFAVSNLATDLRDGIRLTRVIELLSNNFVLMKKLRAPAISRLQKIHNADVAFKHLAEQGLRLDKDGLKVLPKDIVEGHREKTLRLLWSLILEFQIDVLLNTEQLKQEIKILEDSLKVKNQLAALQRFEQGLEKKKRESGGLELHTRNEKLGLLLKWCRVVCAFYGVKIENFTVSFGDGRALCYLVHHYHPALVPGNAIKSATMATYYADMEQRGQGDLDNSFSNPFSPAVVSVLEDPALYEELLANEKDNFKLLYEKVSELGGIPLMLRSVDMSNTIPDEKVVVTYLTYLCSRLLDIRHESRAARIIQLAWRKYYLKKSQKEFEVKQAAAIVIQREVRSFLARYREKKQASAAVKIQSVWRGHAARKLAQQIRYQHENALKIQAARIIKRYLQTYVLRKKYLLQKKSAIVIQAHVRGCAARCSLGKQQNAAKTIQNWYLSHKCMKSAREEFKLKKKSAIIIQRYVRDWLRKTSAAIKLQSYVRVYFARKRYLMLRNAVLICQQRYRIKRLGLEVRKDFCMKKEAAIKIQAWYRGQMVRNRIQKQHRSARIIQAWYKKCVQRKTFLSMKNAARTIQCWYRSSHMTKCYRQRYLTTRQSVVTIQKYFRGFVAHKNYRKTLNCIIKIQSHVRCLKALKSYRRLKWATDILQKRYRAHIAGLKQQTHYQTMKKSAIVIQSAYRAARARRDFKLHKSARLIQANFRGFVQRKKYLALRNAAVCLQSNYRSYRARKEYQHIQSVVTCLQRRVRATLKMRQCRHDYQSKVKSAVLIQSFTRGFIQRQKYKHQVELIKKLQSRVRGYQQLKRFRVAKSSAITIQRHVRIFLDKCRERRRQRTAAIKIQSAVKCYLEKKRFVTLRNAVLACQRRYRANKLGHQEWRKFMITKGAAITIQAWFRGQVVRRALQKQHQSATVIQACYRGYRQVQRYRSMKHAAKTIQTWYRGCVTTKTSRAKYLHMRNSAITIQRHYRGLVQQRKYSTLKHAAKCIKSHYKAYRVRKEYLHTISAIKTLQRRMKATLLMRQCRHDYQLKVKSIIMMQSCIRGFIERQKYKHQMQCITRLQARVRGSQQLKKFRLMKSSAILIQRQVRKFLNKRREQKKLLAAALVIQSAARGYLVRKRIVSIKNAVLVCQRQYRANKLRHQAWRKFMITKGAAITIQAWFRGQVVRRALQKQHQSATVIQACFRGHRQMKKFQTMKCAAKTIQTWYRGCLPTRTCRQKYLKVRDSVITIQKHYRRLVQRQRFLHLKCAAVCLQSHYKAYRVRKEYKQTRSAVISLQRRLRAKTLGRRVWRDFMITKGAAITIQAHFRGKIARNRLQKERQSATLIQAYYRRHQQVKQFKSIKCAAEKIQGWYRGCLATKPCREKYLQIQNSVITIQKHYRCFVQRQRFLRLKCAAVCLQSHYKAYRVRKEYKQKRSAIITLQRRYRAKTLGHRAWRQFMITKGAAITIQARFRGQVVRRTLQKQHQSATVIQACYRRHQQVKQFNSMKCAARKIQAWYRGCLATKTCREKYLQIQKSVNTIQKHYRCFVQRQRFLRLKCAAVCLQSHYKAYRVRKEYKQTRSAIISLQRRFRAKTLGRRVWRQFMISKGAAITIQAHFRGKLVRDRLQKQQQSATLIQACYRRHQQVKRFNSLKCAAEKVQAWYRGCLATKTCREKYLQIQKSVNTIQKHYRCFVQRQRFLRLKCAAVCLQSHYKGYRVRKEYKQTRSAIITLQRRYRAKTLGHRAWRQFMISKGAALTIQAHFRGKIVRDRLRKEQQSATLIQSCYRRHQQVKQFNSMKCAALKIQAWYRGCLATKTCREKYLQIQKSVNTIQKYYRCFVQHQRFLRLKCAAVCLQSHYKGYRVRKEYKQTRSAIISLQRRYRAKTLGLQVWREFMITKGAAITIQARFRGQVVRRALQKQHQSATVIQACYRRRHQVKSYKSMKCAAQKIQAWYRGCRKTHCLRQIFLQTRRSVLTIQRYCRGMLSRKSSREMVRSIVTIQAVIRGRHVKRQYRRLQWSANVIQTRYREYKQRQLIKIEEEKRKLHLKQFTQNAVVNMAAIRIQCCYRKYKMLIQARKQLQTVLILQRWFRSKLCRLRFLKFRRAVCVFQRASREYLHKRHAAARTIQTQFRKWMVQREEQQRIQAATTLQAIWRGRKVRKGCKNKKIEIVRKSLQEANRSATEEKKLGNRTSSALDYLLKYKQLSHILEALIHLDVATRLSPACCERMVEVNAVSVIYRLIRSCNRSQPHMELIKYSVNILLNLAKYDKTAADVYNVEESIDTLIELMQIYREKGAIFSRTCMLLGIMGMEKCRRDIIRSNTKLADKIRSIHSLTVRKHRIDEKRLIRQAKQIAAKSFNSTLPTHLPHKKQYKVRPDWILRKDNMREIEDPLQAINFVMDSLQICPK